MHIKKKWPTQSVAKRFRKLIVKGIPITLRVRGKMPSLINAYINHDIDDAIRSNVITIDVLPTEDLMYLAFPIAKVDPILIL